MPLWPLVPSLALLTVAVFGLILALALLGSRQVTHAVFWRFVALTFVILFMFVSVPAFVRVTLFFLRSPLAQQGR